LQTPFAGGEGSCQGAAELPLNRMHDCSATLDDPKPFSQPCSFVTTSEWAGDGQPKNAVRSKAGVWQRRVVRPVRELLTRGVCPDRIAATVATGAVCSLCPMFGATTLLNVAAGTWLRMNHPILQALNQLFGPVQLVMIVGYVRFGGWIFGRGGDPFTLAEVTRTFHDATFADFLEKFGCAGVHGLLAWLITAPLLFGLVYAPARALTRRFESERITP
jgi:uncharacterized protein (DUF2062 family)